MKTSAKARRAYWVAELAKLSGSFGDDSEKMTKELRTEIKKDGRMALLDHLRFCGAMPEQYKHDSSEEKLYSKYTDAVISESLAAVILPGLKAGASFRLQDYASAPAQGPGFPRARMGLRSSIVTMRADAADVQARGHNYSLVADAKSFRFSRTAKNQKDFKVQAMDGWRNGLDYAVVVCPIYQMPSRTSQIYRQAVARNVCILSYSHLAALVGFAGQRGPLASERSLHKMLKSVSLLHPSKNANDYWAGINRSLVSSLGNAVDLWTAEKTASLEALRALKEESLRYLRSERNRLLGLSHREALNELIHISGLDSRIAQVERIEHGELLGA